MDTDSELITEEDFWESLGDRPFGCTELQVRFAREYVASRDETGKALPGYAIAEKAGYGGSYKQRSVQASRLLRNEKVKKLIAAALEARNAEKSGVMETDELLELLTKQARHGAGQERLKSQEMLAKINALAESRARIPTQQLFTNFASLHPIATAAAMVIAIKYGLQNEWMPEPQHMQILRDFHSDLLGILIEAGYGHYFTQGGASARALPGHKSGSPRNGAAVASVNRSL